MDQTNIIIEKFKNAMFAQDYRNVIDIIWVKPLELVAAYSDLTILVILEMDSGWEFEKYVSDILYDIELEYCVGFDTLFMAEAEQGSIRCDQPIFENLLQKGFHLCNLTKHTG